MERTRILVVDDDISVTRLLKLGLENTGAFEVQEVNRGSDAVPVARVFRPAAIISDVCMPNIGGADIAFQLQNDAELQSTLLVFLTSIVSATELAENRGMIGGHYYIAKPVRLEKVVAFLEHHLHLPSRDNADPAHRVASSE